MLRIIDEEEKILGYECSECHQPVSACDCVCEQCGRELNYGGFMLSTKRWQCLNYIERSQARAEALALTVAVVRVYGSDWRDFMSPFCRFISDEDIEKKIMLDSDQARWVKKAKERYVKSKLAEIREDIDREVEKRKEKDFIAQLWRLFGFQGRYQEAEKAYERVKIEKEKEIRQRISEEAAGFPSQKEYSLAGTIITAERVNEIASQLPPQLVHEKYLA